MRRVFRGVVLLVLVLGSGGVFGIPREGKERTRDPESPVVRYVKRVVRSLGDGLTLPTPAPTPGPKP